MNATQKTAEEQAARCLPLIEEERRAFIKKELGRLEAIIGIEYWDGRTDTSHAFHQVIEEGKEMDTIIDAYELTVEELALLPKLTKRVERIGTVSYLALYPMFPEDKNRLALLAEIHTKLTAGTPCTDDELKALTEGHGSYLDWKTADAVTVIMPD
jgi:hypothetical protein